MKKTKSYNSFEEIHEELRILKLKKQLDMLYLKNNVSQVKDNLTPMGLVSGALSAVNLDSLANRNRWLSWAIELGMALLRRRR